MNIPPRYLAAIALLLAAVPCQFARGDAPPSAQAVEAANNQVLLADKIESLVFNLEETHPKPSAAFYRYTIALYDGAARLNPNEPRYYRSIFNYMSGLGDINGKIAALNSYIQLVPDDRFAQIALMDAYVTRMQTVDKAMSYLRSIIGKNQLPASVRSHAAVLCALAMMNRSQNDEASKMLDTALTINPLERTALGLKYGLSLKEGPTIRAGLLLAILRSCPMDPDASTSLADTLAEVGLVRESVSWFGVASQLYTAMGRTPRAELVLIGAPELYLNNQGHDAIQLTNSYLNEAPDSIDAWNIRLAVERDTRHDPQSYDGYARVAVRLVDNRLQTIRHDFLGAPGATTRPVNLGAPPAASDLTVPDLSGDRALLVKKHDVKVTDAYVNALQDEAWLRLYFRADASDDTGRLLSALASLLPDDDVVLARLQGWSYRDQGKNDAAMQKFTAVADRDPFAALGAVLTLADDPAKKVDAVARAKVLMANNPQGPVAAVLYGALHSMGAEVIPLKQADSVKAALGAFPTDWLNIMSRPQDFYGLTVEPARTEFEYGEAVILKVTLANLSDYDMTIADNGVLIPQLLYDAQFRGAIQTAVPNVMMDRFWQRTVLPARQEVVQYERVDRGKVAAILDGEPDQTLELGFNVTSNPVSSPQGLVTGPMGYQVQLSSLIERPAALAAISPGAIATLCDTAANGTTGEQRMAAITAASTIVAHLGAGQDANATQQVATAILKQLHDSVGDPDRCVGAWAQFRLAQLTPADQLNDTVKQMVNSDQWYIRFLGLIAGRNLPDKGAAVDLALSSDNDPTIKELAIALSDELGQEAAEAAAAATQPSPANNPGSDQAPAPPSN